MKAQARKHIPIYDVLGRKITNPMKGNIYNTWWEESGLLSYNAPFTKSNCEWRVALRPIENVVKDLDGLELGEVGQVETVVVVDELEHTGALNSRETVMVHVAIVYAQNERNETGFGSRDDVGMSGNGRREGAVLHVEDEPWPIAFKIRGEA